MPTAQAKLMLSREETETLVQRLRATQAEENAERFETGRELGIQWGLRTATHGELEGLATLEENIVSVGIEENSLGGWLDQRSLDLTDPHDMGVVQGAEEVWANAVRGGIER